MTKRAKLFLQIGVLAVPVLAFIAVLLHSVVLFRDFDAESGYYAAASPLPQALSIYLAVCGLILLVYTLAMRKKFPEPTYENTPSALFATAYLAVTMAVTTVCCLFALPTFAESDAAAAAATGVAPFPFNSIFAVLAAISAFVSLFYAALMLWKDAPLRLRAGTSVGPVFYALSATLYLYFDRTVQMNHPQKVFQLFTLLLICCYALSECRHRIGRAKPAFAFFIGSCTLIVSATYAIPNLVYTLLHHETLVLSTVGDFVIFAFFLYILARHLQLLPSSLPALHRVIGGFLAQEEAESAAEEADVPTAKEAVAAAEVPEEETGADQ